MFLEFLIFINHNNSFQIFWTLLITQFYVDKIIFVLT